MALSIKKPKAMMFDVSGTLTQSTFIPKVLVPYFKAFHKVYIEDYYDTEVCQMMIRELREEAKLNTTAPKIEQLEMDKKAIIDSISRYVNYCLNNSFEGKAFTLFRFQVWFDGLSKGNIQTPVYSDVAIQLQNWHCTQDIKLFVLSNGWSVATRKFMEKTTHGDLSLLISEFWDTDVGDLNKSETYKNVAQKIGDKPEDIMFLSKNIDEAKVAKAAGFVVVLVFTHRSQMNPVIDICQAENIPYIRSLNGLIFT